MAVDALGAERVRCVMLPYRFTSQDSLDDAAAVAQGARHRTTTWCRSRRRCRASKQTLAPLFKGLPRDVTEENLQARARGTILMAISNKFGLMVVTTGNKSEMSVGYATLYGDMNGGFNPVKDLYKTEVYRLARLRNAWKPDGALGPDGRVIPERIITTRADRGAAREPDRPGFAAALRRARRHPGAAGRARGADRGDRRGGFRPARRWRRSSACSTSPNTSAAKSAPGVKVTLRNFGRDRRYPIVNRFRDSGAPLPEPDRALLKDRTRAGRARRSISERPSMTHAKGWMPRRRQAPVRHQVSTA